MKTKFTYDFTNERKVQLINEEIIPYIEGCNEIERNQYNEELKRVSDDWVKLINSGVYHDAIGKVESYKVTDESVVVNVLTEY
jgi:hypothetical protein